MVEGVVPVREVPAGLKPIIEDWFNPDIDYESGLAEGSVVAEIAGVLSRRVHGLNRYIPDFVVGSKENFIYMKRVMSLARGVLTEGLIEPDGSTKPAAVVASQIVNAFKSGAIKDGKFWKNEELGQLFFQAKTKLFDGLDDFAKELKTRYNSVLQAGFTA